MKLISPAMRKSFAKLNNNRHGLHRINEVPKREPDAANKERLILKEKSITQSSSRFATRRLSFLSGTLFFLLSLSAQACEKIVVTPSLAATLKDYGVERVDVPCDQALYALMHSRAHSEDDLSELAKLVKAGNVPRRWKDDEDRWWEASSAFLYYNAPTSGSDRAPPMQGESYALYVDLLLPKLENEPLRDSDFDWIVKLTHAAVSLPDAAALKTLNLIEQRLDTAQRRRWHAVVGEYVLRTALDLNASPVVLHWVLKRSTPQNTADALMLAVDHHNTSGVKNLLDAGVNPIAKFAIRHALTYKKWEASQVLLAAIPPHLRQHHETLEAADADDLLRYLALTCHRHRPEASDIDLAVALGANPTRAFQYPQISVEMSLPARAIACPEYIPPLVKHGLDLDLPYPPIGQPPLIASMRLTGELPGDQSKALEVMLRAHNNVNMRDPSSDRGMRPLSYAILVGDPRMITTLLNFGADPQALDRAGIPAWYDVFNEDRLDLLMLILKMRPKLSLQKLPAAVVSPLGRAKCLNATKIAAFLQQHGAKETRTELRELACKQSAQK